MNKTAIRTPTDRLRRQVVGSEQTAGGLEWGYALPGEPTGANDEYIGYLVSTQNIFALESTC